jgi:hypothetical protein
MKMTEDMRGELAEVVMEFRDSDRMDLHLIGRLHAQVRTQCTYTVWT